MKKKWLKYPRELARVISDVSRLLLTGGCRIPVYYFDGRPNVGDALNPYLIEKIASRKIYKAKSTVLPHLMAVGSVLGKARSASVVWGAGLISNEAPSSSVDKSKIYALRGMKSRELLSQRCAGGKIRCPLGDPAVLLPLFYSPSPFVKREKIGIVCHFIDASLDLVERIDNDDAILLIDVGLAPEEFIDQIVSCKYILSSSLHGLIISDAYNIPNKWVIFSDRIVGGNFKYEDYYSTTISPNETGVVINSRVDLDEAIAHIKELASVATFAMDKEELLSAFPKRYLRKD